MFRLITLASKSPCVFWLSKTPSKKTAKILSPPPSPQISPPPYNVSAIRMYLSVQQVFGHSMRGASARWQRRVPHHFPHRYDRTSQHSSSIKSINKALKIIRIGDSESPRRALPNGIALIRLYDKVKSPCSHSQLETPGTLPPLPPWAAATLPPHGQLCQCRAPAVIQE